MRRAKILISDFVESKKCTKILRIIATKVQKGYITSKPGEKGKIKLKKKSSDQENHPREILKHVNVQECSLHVVCNGASFDTA